ncbi:MAG: HDIG domain-containing protein [Prevotella sp.]|nr:HDIG domain-containing protein [Prevotella sp.]
MGKFNIKQNTTWKNILVRTAIVLCATVAIVAMMPRDSNSFVLVEKGKPWQYADFTAPFDFPIYKSEATLKAERDSITAAHTPYYIYNADVETTSVRQFLNDFPNGIEGLPSDFISIIANRLHAVYKQGIMPSDDYGKLMTDTTSTINMVSGKNASQVKVKDLLSTKRAYEQLLYDETLYPHRQQLQKCNLSNYISANLLYDEERSRTSLNEMLNSIPMAVGQVQTGQKIIDRGEIVSEGKKLIIDSYVYENERRGGDSNQFGTTTWGQLIFVFMLLTLFTTYLGLFRKDYFEHSRNAAMMYALIILFAVITAIMVRNTFIHVYILPYTLVPIFIRVFMDSRTAFVAHVTMVLICAVMLQHKFEFIIVQTVAGLVAIHSLRSLQYRSQLFRTALLVTMASLVIQFALDLLYVTTINKIDTNCYHYLIVSGVALLFAYPLLYLVEKVFGFISDITLIELSNTNNELLRKMSEVAPGTFQHSIQVGNLAAEIANKIGAKSEEVRMGALYHDIGKILSPVYFTENQTGVNPHDGLPYTESAAIIIAHVTEGLKLADKHGLPQLIKDFIATHHGMSKTKYFYVKYKNEHPDEYVDELQFTYPGPNPTTREQAILMMADGVEAASRSLPDYREQTIRNMVNRMIDGMLTEGFFRECPLTFRDVSYAKTVLIEKLKTIYHTRVSYPQLNKKEEKQEKTETK